MDVVELERRSESNKVTCFHPKNHVYNKCFQFLNIFHDGKYLNEFSMLNTKQKTNNKNPQQDKYLSHNKRIIFSNNEILDMMSPIKSENYKDHNCSHSLSTSHMLANSKLKYEKS